MKDFVAMVGSLSSDVYENLKKAVELGKWQDGRKVTVEQLELCMQAIIIWEQQHLAPEQHTAYMQDKCKSHNEQEVIAVRNLQ